jgi:hypothetical protein
MLSDSSIFANSPRFSSFLISLGMLSSHFIIQGPLFYLSNQVHPECSLLSLPEYDFICIFFFSWCHKGPLFRIYVVPHFWSIALMLFVEDHLLVKETTSLKMYFKFSVSWNQKYCEMTKPPETSKCNHDLVEGFNVLVMLCFSGGLSESYRGYCVLLLQRLWYEMQLNPRIPLLGAIWKISHMNFHAEGNLKRNWNLRS